VDRWISKCGSIDLRCGRWQDVLADVTKCDAVITDPPYDAEAHTQQRRVKRGHNRGVVGIDGRKACSAPLSFEPLSFELRKESGEFISKIVRRWAIVFCQVESTQEWRSALVPLSYKRTCVWIKPDAMPQYSGDRPGMGYESIVCCHAVGRSRWNGGGRVGVFTHNKNSGGKHQHETQKPILLMRQIVSLFSDQGDLILDPFAGSGTTLLAAAIEGRRAIGAEMDPKTFALAVKRLKAGWTPETLFSTGPEMKQGGLL
jgi:site-specific DNA-methyltransferase (adenine-specific)